MKLLLKELINPNTALLTDTQKSVLVIIHVSTSPKMAFADTNVSENLVTARNSLAQLNMVLLNIKEGKLAITEKGVSMLMYHNLVDDTGKLTEDGTDILDASRGTSGTFNDEAIHEKFSFLSSLL